MPSAIKRLTDEIANLREAVEKCIGKPIENEPSGNFFKKEDVTKKSDFDVLAVTNVQVFPFKDSVNLGHMKGMASVVLNDQFQVRGLRVMEGENGLYVGYPNDPFYKGEEYRSICLPVTRQLREHIENCVLEKYHECLG